MNGPIDVCTAMVLVIREDILTNDFADNVKLLQVKFYSFAITFSKKKTLPLFLSVKQGTPEGFEWCSTDPKWSKGSL